MDALAPIVPLKRRHAPALIAFDEQLRIVAWDPAAEALTGIAAEQALGRYCWEILRGHRFPTGTDDPHLTVRESEVLELLAQGLPAKVIANRLQISVSTARNHIRKILAKLRARSQLEALAKARSLGLV